LCLCGKKHKGTKTQRAKEMYKMGMTITEKILAAHAGAKKVEPGDLINAKVDIALGNDITAPIAIDEFHKSGAKKVFDKDRVILVPDHFVPNKDIKSAMQAKMLREFAKEQELTHFLMQVKWGLNMQFCRKKGLCCPVIWLSVQTVIPVLMAD